jgi:protein-disulfide isomerase
MRSRSIASGLLVALGVAGAASAAEPRRADPTRIYQVPVAGAPSRGPADAKVTIVEFGDYHCPYCAAEEQVVAALVRAHPGDVRLVFRNLVVHPSAELPAQAALAAAEQGKYWEAHDAFFADINKTRTREAVETLVKSLGLDMARFDADLDSGRYLHVVEADAALADRLGALGTPMFYVNGRPLSGMVPLARFENLVTAEIARADALLRTGVPRAALYRALVADGDEQAPVVSGGFDGSRRYPVTLGTAPARGLANARVTLVVFAEFECPFCGRLYPVLKALEARYGSDLRVVFKHFPAVRAHTHARLAARAAIAAGSQGKFWEMHDLLYEHQKALTRAEIDGYAAQLGLDVARFDRELDLHTGDAQVLEDMDQARSLGISGVPTSFINGRPMVGINTEPAFREVIDEEIKSADALIAQGVKPEALYEKLISGTR